MKRWGSVAIPLLVCLVLLDAVVRQFVADRAFRRANKPIEEYEKNSVLFLRGERKRPAFDASVGPFLRKAVRVEPRCPAYRNYLGRYFSARATDPSLSDTQRMDLAKQAIEEYERAAELDPLNGVYWAYLAYMQGVMARYYEALARDPSLPDDQRMVLMRQATEEDVNAVTNFVKAVRLNRSNEWIWQVYDGYREWSAPAEEVPEASATPEP
jgi:tetratricopeptide (TPR) repeat protein